MLGRKFHLPISSFPKSATTYRGSFITVKNQPNLKEFSRLGVIISSKYDKRAVYRNNLKRKFFQSFSNFFLYQNNPGRDILVIVNSKIKSDSQKNIINEFIKILNSYS